ncbi:MAG: hypothetical protein HF982_06845 [Desulfobacteraceae bacterium]|nr:hypothetical protein [Desulfobacteraceae bacterium]MBC2719288.1 hypothetical protein [Desulfobacteraceae bacterium]
MPALIICNHRAEGQPPANAESNPYFQPQVKVISTGNSNPVKMAAV